MNVNLLELQRVVIGDYNRVVSLLKKAEKDRETDKITLYALPLERALSHLHNSLAFVGSLIDPDTGKSFLGGAEVRMDSWDFDEE